jgi:hypothetical protein
MVRGSPAMKVTVVSGGGGPAVSSTIASANGMVRMPEGAPTAPSRGEREPPQAAAARQSQLARPQSPRNIPAIHPLAVRG